jgi:nucleotide-binding universal stress UspA family protein
MRKLIAEDLRGCKVIPCVATGDPAARIIEHASLGRAGLIMMPTHGYGLFRRFLLGSVTAKVLHDADCPVWTSAHLEGWPVIEHVSLRSLLCGVDFGPRSRSALKCAAGVAAEFQAKLIVAHVIPAFDAGAAELWPEDWRDQAVKSAEERVKGVIRELEDSLNAAIASVEILDGSPASALSEAAERLDVDLMVIGRTHTADLRGNLGANAYAVIAHSPCPVLSV